MKIRIGHCHAVALAFDQFMRTPSVRAERSTHKRFRKNKALPLSTSATAIPKAGTATFIFEAKAAFPESQLMWRKACLAGDL